MSIENETAAAAKELIVFVDDVTCRLTLPIGESTCTCPSRSMCKHIVMAVIFAKEKFAGQTSDKLEAAGEIEIRSGKKRRQILRNCWNIL